MQTAHDAALRGALLRLGARPPSVTPSEELALPPLLRAPAIALSWMALVIVAVCLLALSRIQVPRVARGVAVAVGAAPDSVSLLMLLPTTAAAHVRLGQQVTLDVGDTSPIVLGVAGVDSVPLDGGTARRRFPGAASLFAHLEAPKVAVTLSRCARRSSCLTPTTGVVYAATASLGTRSLASYAWSGTPSFTR